MSALSTGAKDALAEHRGDKLGARTESSAGALDAGIVEAMAGRYGTALPRCGRAVSHATRLLIEYGFRFQSRGE